MNYLGCFCDVGTSSDAHVAQIIDITLKILTVISASSEPRTVPTSFQLIPVNFNFSKSISTLGKPAMSKQPSNTEKIRQIGVFIKRQ